MRFSRAVAIVGGLTLTVGLGSFVGVFFSAFRPLSSGPKVTAVVLVERRQPPAEITRVLREKGIVSDSAQFIKIGRYFRKWGKIKAGEYLLASDMTPLAAFGVLTSGVSMARVFTVREGLNLYEIGDAMEAAGLAGPDEFAKLCQDARFVAKLWGMFKLPPPAPPRLEGYLFPDTYHFNRTLSLEDMVTQMVRKFATVYLPEWDALGAALHLKRHEIVTLASMIEKETGAPSERPMISSVFHNRLRKRMKLQSDPTTIYGIWDRYDGNIHKRDLLHPTPYNTYTVPALPIGPISNPGREALWAAVHPATSEFLFFVSHNDGTHEFTRSFKDHEAAVRKFQLDPKAREGKSWRDLKKK